MPQSKSKSRVTKKKVSVSSLKKKLDTIFSQYIRRKWSNHAGYCQCVTCGVVKPWQELQAGHYISRRFNSTRYMEENVFPQCVGCNCFHHGEMDKFALFLIDMYGVNHLDELGRLRNERKQFSVSDLQVMIDEFTKKLKDIN